MAYSISFAPSAASRMESFSPAIQRHIFDELVAEANQIAHAGESGKKLRRMQVEDHRVVLLELHASQQLLVLKVADPGEMLRRLKGLPDPEPHRPPLDPPEPVIDMEYEPEPDEEPAPAQPEEAPEEPEPGTMTEETPTAEPTEEAPRVRPQGPGLDRLKRDFLKQVVEKGESLLEELGDLTLARQWGVRIAGSAGAYGQREMADLGRVLAEIDSEDKEGAAHTIELLLDRARNALVHQ